MSSKNRHPLGTKKNKNQSVLEVTNQLRKSGSVEKREVENQAFGPFGSICSFKGTKWLLKNRRSYHLYIYIHDLIRICYKLLSLYVLLQVTLSKLQSRDSSSALKRLKFRRACWTKAAPKCRFARIACKTPQGLKSPTFLQLSTWQKSATITCSYKKTVNS